MAQNRSILVKNNSIRTELFKRNLPNSNIIDSNIPKVGEYYDIYYNKYSSPAEWKENTSDYLDYIENTYGSEFGVYKFIKGLLSSNSIEYSDELNYVGVVYPDLSVPFSDSNDVTITTNPNSFIKGTYTLADNIWEAKDTKLGIQTSIIYPRLFKRGANFNTLRRRGAVNGTDNNGEATVLSGKTSYITPDLYNVYGNNNHNQYNLETILEINSNTGRINDIEGTTDDFIVEYSKTTHSKNGGKIFLDEVIDKANKELIELQKGVDSKLSGLYYYKKIYNDTDTYLGVDGLTNYYSIDKDHLYNDDNVQSTYGVTYSQLTDNTNDIIGKTKKLFENKRIHDYFISQYSISGYTKGELDNVATTNNGERSRGRALISNNGFCRAWGQNNPYSGNGRNRYKLIRPFNDDDAKDLESIQYKIRKYRTKGNDKYRGDKYLVDNTVLNASGTGLVNVGPTKASDVKKCMFSIENLAWKDVLKTNLSEDQRGPNGGRIMWFPPYDLKFQESVTVNWNSNSFIGRGEKIHTYTDTDRTGQLSFCILVDHPSVAYDITQKGDELSALQFFAGCKMTELTKSNEDEEEKNPEPIESEFNKIPYTVKLFFPNSFSGKDIDDIDKLLRLMFYQTYYKDESDVILNPYELTDKGSSVGSEDTSLSGDAYYHKYLNDKYVCAGGFVNGYIQLSDFNDIKICYLIDRTPLKEKEKYEIDYIDSKSYGLNKPIYEWLGKLYTLPSSSKSYELNSNDKILTNPISNSKNTDKDKFILLPDGNGNFVNVNVKDITEITYGGCVSDNALDKTTRGEGYQETLTKSRGNMMKLLIEAISSNFDLNVNVVCKNKEIQNTNSNDRFQLENTRKRQFGYITFNIKQEDVTSATNSTSDNVTVNKSEASKTENGTSNNANDKTASTTKKKNKTNGEVPSEYKYFSDIADRRTYDYETIIEKFKYFTPAFHSITPEGFNERLNFLQQCTRQGHTIAAGENGGGAGNLAFGRMPVCVLRIGDFIHTRVIIQSLQIDYDNGNGMQLDLNPEGIGVQPMYAKVSMGIVLLGGQSLSGPISRLQNAISFDYYANTGVYDSKADIVDDGIYQKIWTPSEN